jgi:hypothetical protein
MSESGEHRAAGVFPVAPRTIEGLYFRLLLSGLGLDPKGFKFWKFAHRQGERIRVRVFGRGSAAVYDVAETESWTSLFAEDLRSGRFNLKSQDPLNKESLGALWAMANVIRNAGVRAGLEILNRRVPHRFTAVYKLADGVMGNIVLVDKEKSLDTLQLQAIPLTDSFCQFALKDGFFITMQSGSDARLNGHPYSGVVGSYVGVPIPNANGSGLYGTLCHFDFKERPIPDQEFRLLERIALILSPHLDGAARHAP